MNIINIRFLLKAVAKFLFEGVETKTIKAALEYKPPLIISRNFSLMKIIEAAVSIQENTVASRQICSTPIVLVDVGTQGKPSLSANF